MDPQHATDTIIDSLVNKQWFVAAIILLFFLFFVGAAVWIGKKLGDIWDKFEGLSNSWQTRLDARDQAWFARLDKRDDETKEMVHNYYNASGTTSLSMQALNQGMNGLADKLDDLETAVSSQREAK